MNAHMISSSKAHMIAALPRNRRVGGSVKLSHPIARMFSEKEEMGAWMRGFRTGALMGVLGLGLSLALLCR